MGVVAPVEGTPVVAPAMLEIVGFTFMKSYWASWTAAAP